MASHFENRVGMPFSKRARFLRDVSFYSNGGAIATEINSSLTI